MPNARTGATGSSSPGDLLPDSGDDPRLIRALEAYVEAVERGDAFDRDRFFADHAELGPQLMACLEGLEVIQAARPELHRSVSGTLSATRDVEAPTLADDAVMPRRLGEFEIRREVGRGGMGVVYEAYQPSLDRIVALKVLPYAATLDPRQLQRFRTEAQAAASLQHPHIVPVHAVGSERGVHYFAMQFIDGRPLSDLICGWRLDRKAADRAAFRAMFDGEDGTDERPDAGAKGCEPAAPTFPEVDTDEFFRSIAGLGIQAAGALEQAHSFGVLHRDVKPANLLVDGRGHLWISDFGLARIDSHGSVTRSGDILGTLRYMSPEQALGRKAGVDHRSDVYSLGATLYEALTLGPVFEPCDNRELVRRIADELPRSPRRVNPKVPRDLDTIVMKALSKEPSDRYGSCQELAEDLRRFRDDRPIAARPPTAGERFHRWSRRNKVLVQAAAAAVLVALGLMSASTLLLYRERAESNARGQQALLMQRQNLAMASEMWGIAEQLVPQDPGRAELKSRLTTRSLGIFERFARDHDADPALDRDTALAHRMAGDVHFRLGHHAEAEAAYLRAAERLERTGPTSAPTRDESVNELAHVLNRLGRLNVLKMRGGEALRYFERAVAVQGAWADRARWQGPRHDLASFCLDLGQHATTLGDFVRAEHAYSRALAVLGPLPVESDEDHPNQRVARTEINALTQSILSRQLRSKRAFREAEESHRSAVELYRQLVGMKPDRPEYHRRLIESSMQLAAFLANCPDPTIRDPEEGAALVESAMRLDPEDANVRILAAQVLGGLGHHERAEAVLTEVVDRHPDRADALNNLAWMLITSSDAGRHDPARAIRLAERAVHLSPELGIYWNTLGAARLRAGEPDAAIEALERSMALREGGDSFDWFFLAMARHRVGDRAEARRLFDDAVEWMDAFMSHNQELKQFRREANDLLGASRAGRPQPGRV